ncbi:MAG TPA: FMN-binding negative transcriptional regulator [Pseudolabrys sp.]|jgi:transcriptional regulator|nr:FMN-binding negative transcriptional regulator [Pseudolabrys sp.]
MYVPSAFKVHPALALAFAGARGFGLVIACDGGRPVASQVPFLVVEADGKVPRAVFHVARGNPLAALAQKCAPWLIAVQGADAYVSADWYANRDQVPTWLYETVQLGGPVHVLPAEHTRDHLDALTARFEQPLSPKQPWTSAKLAPERLATLMNAIVVIEMQVETVEASFKLNQHKSDADNIAVATALAGQGESDAKAIAARMVALRPHLLYEKHGQPAAPVEGM